MEGEAKTMGQLGRRKSKKMCVENSDGSGILPTVSWMLEEDTNLVDRSKARGDGQRLRETDVSQGDRGSRSEQRVRG